MSLFLELIKMLQKLFHEGLLVFSKEPLINGDVVVFVHLCTYDFLFELVGSGCPLDIATKMSESMNLDNYILKIAPLRYEYITD
jgi:hypothetical protein